MVMVGEAALLFVVVLTMTMLVGYAPVALLTPEDDNEGDEGASLLLVPAVGWAIIAAAL